MRRIDTTARGLQFSISCLLSLLAGGCGIKELGTVEPNGLGNACTIEGAATASPTSTLVATDLLSCASSACIRPALQLTTNTGPLCTQGCDTDFDCLGGQLRDPADPADRRCASGFSCEIPVPKLSGVSLSCQKVCVCRDFLSNRTSHVIPAGCP